VVIGVGGMGEAVARRQGPGRHLLLADANGASLESVAASLKDDGYDVSAQLVDVGSRASVQELADSAAAAGALTQLVHTAGLSPMQASTEAILRVDLYGAALVMEVFGDLIAVGGAGVVIASMAGHLLGPLPAEQEKALMATPTDDLLSLDFVNGIAEPGLAYSIAKNANMLRVKAESLRWGRRRGRLNSISPGVISTPMGRQELDGDHGAGMRAMVGASGTGRVGTPADIVNATAFLLGPESSFITGTDLLVDGGVVAAVGVLK
jgi:NAD(P)-dependent dehydrogenase (short-subunit alcohol dehydrogenase family)